MAHPTPIASPGLDPLVIRAGGDGLSRRGRIIAWSLALALLLVAGGSLYSAGAALLDGKQAPAAGTAAGQAAAAGLGSPATNGGQVAGRSPEGGTYVYDVTKTSLSNAIEAQWDGPTTQLDWKSGGYATAEATFVGDRVFSPGDEVSRTLTVTNAGPSAGVMSIGILVDQALTELTQNPDLAQDVELFWDVAGIQGSQTFDALLDQQRVGTPVVAEVRVPQGAASEVTVGVRMDRAVTGNRNLGTDSTVLTFQVLAQLQGDTSTYQPPAALPKTGVALAGAVALAAALLMLGWLLIARRRRRCDECDTKLTRDEPWSKFHDGDGGTRILCGPCGAPQAVAPTT